MAQGEGPSRSSQDLLVLFFCSEFRCFRMTPWPRVCKNQSFRNKQNLQFLEIARFKCHSLWTRNEPAMFQLDLVCPWPVNWRSQCLVSDKFSHIFLEPHCGHDDGHDSWRLNDGCEVKEAVGLRGDGRHCVEFWLDGHSPERTEWVDGQGQKNKAFEASEWLA